MISEKTLVIYFLEGGASKYSYITVKQEKQLNFERGSGGTLQITFSNIFGNFGFFAGLLFYTFIFYLLYKFYFHYKNYKDLLSLFGLGIIIYLILLSFLFESTEIYYTCIIHAPLLGIMYRSFQERN